MVSPTRTCVECARETEVLVKEGRACCVVVRARQESEQVWASLAPVKKVTAEAFFAMISRADHRIDERFPNGLQRLMEWCRYDE